MNYNPPTTYIIDFFNVFSDYRETYYKKIKVDFHSVKHATLLKDTRDFFDLFFMDYLKVVGIEDKSEFVFVMKKIYNYEQALLDTLEKYKNLNIKFVIVKDRYDNSLVEQNKDDFICQYLLSIYPKSVLISNDNYKNKIDYTFLFLELQRVNIQIIQYNESSVTNAETFYIVNGDITKKINSHRYNRRCLPKSKFTTLYEL